MAKVRKKMKVRKIHDKDFKPQYLSGTSKPFKEGRKAKSKLEKSVKVEGGKYIATASNDAGEVLYKAEARNHSNAMELLESKIGKGHTIDVENILNQKEDNLTTSLSYLEQSKYSDSTPPNTKEVSTVFMAVPDDITQVSNLKIKELFERHEELDDEELITLIEQEYAKRFDFPLAENTTLLNYEEHAKIDEDEMSHDFFDTAEVKIRKKQNKFRESILRAYGGQCMVTGCTVIVVLEAAHIIPFSESPDNSLDNGLVLRADIHKLFDSNLIRITSGYKVKVDYQLKGTEYELLEGKALTSKTGLLPSMNKVSARL
ncbi:HNH endonuclease [Bowmanella pacifica]|uniref:HNH nuclease domain-containing protein n=1 Tax=Bowmanella pacifica TaxID=502051 RepID=A0A918DGR3_9ALTE|nr:HNH endonuclease signature motif containing protein [Bowmanella pacifica]GGO65212.1 hypothetical protein GCM10010982_06470 [Bowmanella pacifica]